MAKPFRLNAARTLLVANLYLLLLLSPVCGLIEFREEDCLNGTKGRDLKAVEGRDP